MFENIIYFIFI